jgi:hypothetical protein
MKQGAGRRRVALAYAGLISLVTLIVILQGILFAVFYSEADRGFLDAHGAVGFISMLLVALILTPLGFLARFPKGLRIEWLTLLLAVLWIAQMFIGTGIQDERSLSIVHIPLALVVFGLSFYLTGKAHRALKGR